LGYYIGTSESFHTSFFKILYVSHIGRTLLLDTISFLLVTLSLAICKLLDASGNKGFWPIMKPLIHCSLHLVIIHKSTTSLSVTERFKQAPDLHCGQGARELPNSVFEWC
jgi:sensor histidine kinase YesM